MTISRKPPTNKSSNKNDKVNIEEIINRGGSVSAEKSKEGRKPILLKLDYDTVDQIDHLVRSRKVKIKRQTWIEEAIIEKLSRNSEGIQSI